MADEVDPASKAGSALTTEQLLDYIKKQKHKIKRLEKDKETLTKQVNESTDAIASANATAAAATAAAKEAKAALIVAGSETKPLGPVASSLSSSSSSSSTSGSMFWDLIDKESPFQRKLAKTAITLLTSTVMKSSFGKRTLQPSRRSLFESWRLRTLELRAEAAAREASEVKAEFASLEQKTAKLKALLSRTHQANKRFEEDTTLFKRAQKDAATQLKAMKEREDSERMALLETVRVHTIESAFQQDMELVIQRAAESMLKSGSDAHGGGSSSSAANANANGPLSATALVASGFSTLSTKLAAADEENAHLKTQLEALEASVNELAAEAKSRQVQLEKTEKELARAKDAVERLTAKAAESQEQAEEGVRLRHDMEMELDILTKGRADMIRCVESSMAEKSAQQIAELRAEVGALRAVHAQSSSSGGSAKAGSSASNGGKAARGNNRLPGRGLAGSAGSDGAAVGRQPLLSLSLSSSSMSLGGGLTPGLVAVSSSRPAPPPVGTMSYALASPSSSPPPGSAGYNAALTAIGDGAASLPSAASTTFVCESLVIKAADDFRLVIPVPACPGKFRLSWDFTVSVPRPRSATAPSSSSSSGGAPETGTGSVKMGRAVDIGFSVMEKLSTGSLPQLLPYSRVRSPGDRNAIILGATYTDGDNNSNNSSSSNTNSNANFSRSLILLFDNSYSWVQSKEITYTVSVDPVQ